jgi:small subunit ribosomal protein S20
VPLDLAWVALYVSPLVRRGRADPAFSSLSFCSSAEVVVPRIKSAKKRMRQGKTHAVLNRTQRSKLRTAIKKVRSAPATEAQAAYDEAVQLIDRAGRKRLIHPNAAARQKSRLAKLTKAGAKK